MRNCCAFFSSSSHFTPSPESVPHLAPFPILPHNYPSLFTPLAPLHPLHPLPLLHALPLVPSIPSPLPLSRPTRTSSDIPSRFIPPKRHPPFLVLLTSISSSLLSSALTAPTCALSLALQGHSGEGGGAVTGFCPERSAGSCKPLCCRGDYTQAAAAVGPREIAAGYFLTPTKLL